MSGCWDDGHDVEGSFENLLVLLERSERHGEGFFFFFWLSKSMERIFTRW